MHRRPKPKTEEYFRCVVRLVNTEIYTIKGLVDDALQSGIFDRETDTQAFMRKLIAALRMRVQRANLAADDFVKDDKGFVHKAFYGWRLKLTYHESHFSREEYKELLRLGVKHDRNQDLLRVDNADLAANSAIVEEIHRQALEEARSRADEEVRQQLARAEQKAMEAWQRAGEAWQRVDQLTRADLSTRKSRFFRWFPTRVFYSTGLLALGFVLALWLLPSNDAGNISRGATAEPTVQILDDLWAGYFDDGILKRTMINRLADNPAPATLKTLFELYAREEEDLLKLEIVDTIARVNRELGQQPVTASIRSVIAVAAFEKPLVVFPDNGFVTLGTWVDIDNHLGYVTRVEHFGLEIKTKTRFESIDFPALESFGSTHWANTDFVVYPHKNNLNTILTAVASHQGYRYEPVGEGLIFGNFKAKSYADFIEEISQNCSVELVEETIQVNPADFRLYIPLSGTTITTQRDVLAYLDNLGFALDWSAVNKKDLNQRIIFSIIDKNHFLKHGLTWVKPGNELVLRSPP